MTKKDYIDIALAVRAARDVATDARNHEIVCAFQDGKNAAIDAFIAALCKTLHADNPRFNAATFTAATTR